MLLELFILFEIIMIGFFITAYFTKQELFWAVSLVLSGVLMVSSYSISFFNKGDLYIHSFPYMMGINLLFFALTLIFGVLDIFDKYGISILGNRSK